MSNVLEVFEECLETITKNNITKKTVMENLQQVVLLVDEMIDEGIIINTDGENIENKIFFKEGNSGSTQETGSYMNVRKFYFILDVFFSKINNFQEIEHLMTNSIILLSILSSFK